MSSFKTIHIIDQVILSKSWPKQAETLWEQKTQTPEVEKQLCQMIDQLLGRNGPSSRWRILLSGLTPKLQLDLLRRLIVYRHPNRNDWRNIWREVKYELRRGWHYRCVLIIAITYSIAAIFEMLSIVVRQPENLINGLLSLAVIVILAFWSTVRRDAKEPLEPIILLSLGFFGPRTFYLELSHLFSNHTVWAGIESLFQSLTDRTVALVVGWTWLGGMLVLTWALGWSQSEVLVELAALAVAVAGAMAGAMAGAGVVARAGARAGAITGAVAGTVTFLLAAIGSAELAMAMDVANGDVFFDLCSVVAVAIAAIVAVTVAREVAGAGAIAAAVAGGVAGTVVLTLALIWVVMIAVNAAEAISFDMADMVVTWVIAWVVAGLAGGGLGAWNRTKKPEKNGIRLLAVVAFPWFCWLPIVGVFGTLGLHNFLPLTWLQTVLVELFLVGTCAVLWRRGQQLEEMARNPLQGGILEAELRARCGKQLNAHRK